MLFQQELGRLTTHESQIGKIFQGRQDAKNRNQMARRFGGFTRLPAGTLAKLFGGRLGARFRVPYALPTRLSLGE
jgi:hypothetical protein